MSGQSKTEEVAQLSIPHQKASPPLLHLATPHQASQFTDMAGRTILHNLKFHCQVRGWLSLTYLFPVNSWDYHRCTILSHIAGNYILCTTFTSQTDGSDFSDVIGLKYPDFGGKKCKIVLIMPSKVIQSHQLRYQFWPSTGCVCL